LNIEVVATLSVGEGVRGDGGPDEELAVSGVEGEAAAAEVEGCSFIFCRSVVEDKKTVRPRVEYAAMVVDGRPPSREEDDQDEALPSSRRRAGVPELGVVDQGVADGVELEEGSVGLEEGAAAEDAVVQRHVHRGGRVVASTPRSEENCAS